MMRRPGIIQTTGLLYALGATSLVVGGGFVALEGHVAMTIAAVLFLSLGLSSALLALLHDLTSRH